MKYIGFAILGLVLGLLISSLSRNFDTASDLATVQSADLAVLPDFQYPDLDGRLRHSTEWRDKILVLNFWATWCPPCRKETPAFVALQTEYRLHNIQFVGVAVDDPEQVRTFAETYGVNYPILLGDLSAMELSRKLGNRFETLPYTLVVAPGGQVMLRQPGEMHREALETVLKRIIADTG